MCTAASCVARTGNSRLDMVAVCEQINNGDNMYNISYKTIAVTASHFDGTLVRPLRYPVASRDGRQVHRAGPGLAPAPWRVSGRLACQPVQSL